MDRIVVVDSRQPCRGGICLPVIHAGKRLPIGRNIGGLYHHLLALYRKKRSYQRVPIPFKQCPEQCIVAYRLEPLEITRIGFQQLLIVINPRRDLHPTHARHRVNVGRHLLRYVYIPLLDRRMPWAARVTCRRYAHPLDVVC